MLVYINVCLHKGLYIHARAHTQVNTYTGMSGLFDVSVKPSTVHSEQTGCTWDVTVTQDHSLDESLSCQAIFSGHVICEDILYKGIWQMSFLMKCISRLQLSSGINSLLSELGIK